MAIYNLNGTSTPPNPLNGNQLPKQKLPFESTGLGIFTNTIKGLPRAALGVAKDLAQGFTRSIASTGLSVRNATVGKIPSIGYKEAIPAPLPDDNSPGAKLHRFIYGQESVEDLAYQVGNFERSIKESPTAKKFGLDKAALPLAFGGVIGSASLDLIPGGSAEKNAIKSLTKEATEEGVFKILKSLKFEDDVIKKFAADIADAQTEKEVADILLNTKSMQGSKIFNRYLDEGADAVPAKKTIAPELEPLAAEARKFDTPSEFADSLRKSLDDISAKDTTFIGKQEDLIIKNQNIAQKFDEQFGKGSYDIVGKNINDISGAGKKEIDNIFNTAKSKGFPDEIVIDRAAIEKGVRAQEKLVQREKTQLLRKYGENTGELRREIDDISNATENLKEIVNNSPAKDLWKKLFRFTKVIDGKKPYLETGLDQLNAGAVRDPKSPEFLRRLDTAISEYGYNDLDEATKGIEEWLSARKQLKEFQQDRAALVRDFQEAKQQVTDKLSLEKFLNQSSKETERLIAERDAKKYKGNKAKATKALEAKALEAEEKGYTPEITKANGGVVPPESRGGIKSPELNFTEWKDKGALSLNRETMERNLERIAGKEAEKVKDFIVAPTRKNETDRIRFSNSLRKETNEKIVKKLGIRAGSIEDQIVQKYGEGIMTPEDMAKLGKKIDMKKIQEASRYFKSQYDMLLDKVNGVREKFGYTPIPKRTDYFRHFQEIDDSIRSFGLIFREQDLPTELAGITGVFSPGKPFSTAEMQRKGLSTTYSAIKGFDNYLDTITKQIYHIDSVQRGRALEKYIRNSSKAINKIRGKTEGEMTQIKLPNFVANLHDYTNIVAGKKSALDRAFESMVGRPLYGITNWLRRKTSANMVGANLSSAITNFAPLTSSLATTRKMPAIRGLGEGLLSPFKDSDLIDGISSSFLTRRYPEKHTDLVGLKKGVEFANALFETVDKFTAKSIVAGKYFDLLARGAGKEAAMKSADEYAGRIMADRSLANTPNLLGSQSLGFITQFQTEVNNIYSFLKHDIPHINDGSKRKIASSLAQFAIYSYLFNTAFQQVTGRRPILDPIQMGLQLFGLTSDTENDSLASRIGQSTGDLAGNIPFIGGITGGRFPISAGIPNLPALFRGETTWPKELAKPAYFLLPPAGGLQAKKSIEGLSAYLKGKSKSATGKTTQYEIDQNTSNLLRAVLFGKSSLPEARKYFNKLDDKKQAPKKSKQYSL